MNLLTFGLKNMGTIKALISGVGMVKQFMNPGFNNQNQYYNPYMGPYSNNPNSFGNPYMGPYSNNPNSFGNPYMGQYNNFNQGYGHYFNRPNMYTNQRPFHAFGNNLNNLSQLGHLFRQFIPNR